MTELILPHSIDGGTPITANEHQENYTAIRNVLANGLEGGGGSAGNIKANGVTARELADNLLLRGLPAQNMQEGVVAAGDLKVTPGSGLTLNYAAGTAWVTDDSGLLASGALIPVTVGAATVTVSANASGNPRIDQVILTMTGHSTGTVSLLQGTATGGATLDNRTGAAALPNDAVRVADILMPNGFAGPFVQTTHIRDRRPWARGTNWRSVVESGSIGNGSLTNNTWHSLAPSGTPMGARLEFSGVPVIATFMFNDVALISAPSYTMNVRIGYDDVLSGNGFTFASGNGYPTGLGNSWSFPAQATYQGPFVIRVPFTPTAGSHTVMPQVGTDNNVASSTNNAPWTFTVEEQIRQLSDNAGA